MDLRFESEVDESFDPGTYELRPMIKGGNGRMVHPELRDPEFMAAALQKMTETEIGEMFGMTQSGVANYVKKLGLHAQVRGSRDPRLDDAEWLRYNYVEVGRTIVSIGKELGASEHTVAARFRKFGIGRRGPLTAKEVDIPEWVADDPARLEGPLTKDVICLYVSRYYNVRFEIVANKGDFLGDLHSGKKDGANGRGWHSRRVALWLCRKFFGWSSGRLAYEWDYARHNTALNAFNYVDSYFKSCPAHAEELRRLTQAIQERR